MKLEKIRSNAAQMRRRLPVGGNARDDADEGVDVGPDDLSHGRRTANKVGRPMVMALRSASNSCVGSLEQDKSADNI